MDTLQKKLDFARPPVDEVVLSVQFERLNALLAPHLGEIWQEFKKDGFVHIKEQPPVVPTVEQFPNPPKRAQLHISNTDLARIWFIHEDDNRLIQVQRDRFTFNWRKTESAPEYPGFSSIFEGFKGFYNRFKQVLEKQEIGSITPSQYELTYIDQLLRGDGWDTLDDIGKIYNLFVDSQQSDSFWSNAESMILRTSFPVPDLHGRLHLAIRSRVKMPEQRQTLQTDFTMRGFPGNTEHDAMIAWFKVARDRIREKFTSMFTGDIQTQVWERKQ
jgi:uncharacterized protein (TIGR04255 family)